jgi:hypothetical protein
MCARSGARGTEIQGVKHLQETGKPDGNKTSKTPFFSWQKDEKVRNTLISTHGLVFGAFSLVQNCARFRNHQKNKKKK